MEDNNVIKSIDKIINLIIIGIIIQFNFIIINNYSRDNVKLFSAKFDASSITYFKTGSKKYAFHIPKAEFEKFATQTDINAKNIQSEISKLKGYSLMPLFLLFSLSLILEKTCE